MTKKDRAALTEANEEEGLKRLQEFQARQAKRKRKTKKGDHMPEPMDGPRGKKKKRQSHFDEELTNVKAAKKFRHQPKVVPRSKGQDFMGQKNKADKKHSQKFTKRGKR